MYNSLMPDWIGKTLGKVRIDQFLGRGGMAEVYLGTDINLNRRVAVKTLHSHISTEQENLDRFKREALVVANLRHSNIVQVYDLDVLESQPYIVMEHIPGPSLADYLKSIHEKGEKLPLGTVLRFMPMLADALTYAHNQGMVHRDVKPSNILLHSKNQEIILGEALPFDTEPVITDFGLVRMIDSTTQTMTGVISGTPAYMSPEQARGERADHRSDIYALGITLYEMLAGHLPFDAESMASLLLMHVHKPAPPISYLPPGVQVVINKALQKDPDQRYQSATDLAADLLSALKIQSPTAETVGFTPAPAELIQAGRLSLKLTPKENARPVRRYAIIAVALLLLLSLLGFAIRPLLISPGNSTGKIGLLRFHDVSATLDEVTISVQTIPAPTDGQQYQAWLVGGENRLSLGYFQVDDKGRGDLIFVDEMGRNLLAIYSRIEITLEPAPDPSPNPSGIAVYASEIPPQALIHIRHLLVAFPQTPDQTGLVIGMLEDNMLISQHAREMLLAHEQGNRQEVRKQAEAIANLIMGRNNQDYGDLDGDEEVFDPGDGFGLLLNGESPGYIQGTISHAQFAIDQLDTTETIKLHGEHVIITTRNLEAWSIELRDLALQIVADPNGDQPGELIRQANAYADRMLNGRDLNGNEQIEPIEGEGGALTAYDHTFYMADLAIQE